MATSNFIKVGDKFFSPNHPLAIAWMRQNRSETRQNESDHTNIASKQPKRLKHEDSTDCALQDSKPECDQKTALVAADEGKTQGVGRAVVRFIGYRTRPLDPDNFAGSVKDLLDGLCRAGLLDGDAPWQIRLQTEQVKIGHRKDEYTEIEIEYP